MIIEQTHASLQLAEWRREMFSIYLSVRQNADPAEAWCDWRTGRDRLYRFHPQTPLNEAQRQTFSALPYFEYDPRYRVMGRLETTVDPTLHELLLPAEGSFRFKKFATVHFEIDSQPTRLALYWIEAYGGGIFLPFRDATNGRSSYGGGRYLYDSIKGADLNPDSEGFILDFNFAYNPSCAYSDRWVCPLAPNENWLTLSIEAGEKKYGDKNS